MKKKQILMIIALFIASLNLRPAINSIAPMLETIRDSLGMSASIASLLTSIPVLCMGLFAPVAIKFSGKWGIERVLGWSLFIIGVGTILRFFTDSVSFLLITAFIAGIGIAFVGPLLPGFIKRHFPQHVPSMISVYTVALTLGAALSSSLIVPMQNSMNSWQNALGVWAVIAFVAVLFWWLFVMRHMKPQNQPTSIITKAKMPWTNKKAWLLTMTFGLMAMLFYSITAWLPQIIHGLGYSKSYAASALTIFVIVQIPVSLVLPILLRKLPSRRLWLMISAVLQLVGLLMLAFSIVPWVATVFIGVGAGGLFSLNLLLPLDATNNPQEAAAWSAMTQSAGYVIGATGPLILGWIHDATNSFSTSIVGLIVINIMMMVVQIAATSLKRKQQSGEINPNHGIS
ncbi:MFS transporter [Solibacillus sp. FSL K6-1781]|uniref:MFS transporter n=1 Tax=Solibacillus sp. FSL K6-1781 TaxID=2921474 RepID=UPI003159C4EB